MRLLLDENIPVSFIKQLKKAGYDVEHVNKKCKGKLDSEILDYALATKRAIVTFDSDFCGFRKREHFGIIKINGKIHNPINYLLELLNIINDSEIKNIYFQIEENNKILKEEKVYSKKKHIFKQFRRTTLFLDNI
ncbi:MAG: DUF5615 family PIN-like protein [Ruminococcus sp.]|nr:DUF5615 family PIN-like protein [Ruminococcus sp.]